MSYVESMTSSKNPEIWAFWNQDETPSQKEARLKRELARLKEDQQALSDDDDDDADDGDEDL